MAESNTTIGVFFGSKSPEHDVSIITAELVIRGLRDLGYRTVPVYISKSGRWHIGPATSNSSNKTLASAEYFKDISEKKLAKLPEYALNLAQSRGGKLVFEYEGWWTRKATQIDVAFPTFHGPAGEDGALHGIFETAGVPYVGCDLTSSVIAMDKVVTKLLYQQLDIPTPAFLYATAAEYDGFKDSFLEQVGELHWPLFVKPARSGSSIGIQKVEDEDELEFAIETAFHYDSKVLVEEAVSNVKDLTVAVVGNSGGKLTVSEVQESKFTDGSFFTYDEKYLEDGGAQLGRAEKKLQIPADLPSEVTDEVKDRAREIYTLFECAGTARIDFLYNSTGRNIYANEINTLPGTLYHHLWKASGISLNELLSTLIRLAKDAHQKRQQLTRTFDSAILEHAGGAKGGKLD